MDEFIVKFADIRIKIKSNYMYMRDLCKAYIISDTVYDMQVEVDENKISAMKGDDSFSKEYCESLAIYDEIAKQLPFYNCFVFHGACISYKDKGIIFTAPSGTGKTTHIKLWKKYLGDDVDIVNGDKPIIKLFNNCIKVYGTPYSGKEKWNKNRNVQLHAVCVIRRDKKNNIRKLRAEEAMRYLYNQIYFSKVNKDSGILSLTLFNELLTRCPIYLLECDMSKDALECSYKGIIQDE